MIDGPGDGIGSTQWELLQDVTLEGRSWNGRGCNDWQRNANPLAIEEDKHAIANNRTSNASAKVVHRRARLVASRSGIREIVGCVEPGTVPKLVEISVKLICTRFRDVIYLRRSVAPLIHRVRKRVHRHFRYRVQSENEVC